MVCTVLLSLVMLLVGYTIVKRADPSLVIFDVFVTERPPIGVNGPIIAGPAPTREFKNKHSVDERKQSGYSLAEASQNQGPGTETSDDV